DESSPHAKVGMRVASRKACPGFTSGGSRREAESEVSGTAKVGGVEYRAAFQLSITPDWARRFAYSPKEGWQLSFSPVIGMSVTEEHLRQRVYVPFLEYYLQVKHKDTVR
ncbi:MAG: hypothetical protein KDE33_29660, partial [Bacteroidetes bacterium]|nr:hypothetical protein [Bacteroidota bacterium]